MNGLTLEQLTITQGINTNAHNTLIANQESGELLATLIIASRASFITLDRMMEEVTYKNPKVRQKRLEHLLETV